MHGMQLSIFADAGPSVAVAEGTTPRVRRAAGPSLAARVAAVKAAKEPDAHARAVDAVLTAVTPRITRIARLFIASWPVAHVDADDLTQEVLLEIAASLHVAPDVSVEHAHVWLSALVMRTLYDLRRVATQNADDHRDALVQFAVEQEPDVAGRQSDDVDDEQDDDPHYTRAA